MNTWRIETKGAFPYAQELRPMGICSRGSAGDVRHAGRGCGAEGTMTGIIRAPRPERHYTQIRNDVARDDRLSYRARGCWCASCPMPTDFR